MPNSDPATSSHTPRFTFDDSLQSWNVSGKHWLEQNQGDHKYDGIATGNIVFNPEGKALLIQLDEAIDSSIKDLKASINTSIAKLPEDAEEVEEQAVHQKLNTTIKATGEKIRNKAVAVLTWKKKYDNETASLVRAATPSSQLNRFSKMGGLGEGYTRSSRRRRHTAAPLPSSSLFEVSV